MNTLNHETNIHMSITGSEDLPRLAVDGRANPAVIGFLTLHPNDTSRVTVSGEAARLAAWLRASADEIERLASEASHPSVIAAGAGGYTPAHPLDTAAATE